MTTEKNASSDVNFLDMQAHVGVTKHMGGIEATDELLSLCHIGNAREVLNVGCGIGVGSAYIAKKYGCRIGPFVPTSETWQALWEASGLQERVVKVCQVDARTEVKSRIRWIGWRWLLGAWGRGLRLYITNPAVRQSIQEVFDVPPEVFQYAGYGLFAGRK
jgi:hypothetical protein